MAMRVSDTPVFDTGAAASGRQPPGRGPTVPGDDGARSVRTGLDRQRPAVPRAAPPGRGDVSDEPVRRVTGRGRTRLTDMASDPLALYRQRGLQCSPMEPKPEAGSPR